MERHILHKIFDVRSLTFERTSILLWLKYDYFLQNLLLTQQFVFFYRQIARVCLTILWVWCLKGEVTIFTWNQKVHVIAVLGGLVSIWRFQKVRARIIKLKFTKMANILANANGVGVSDTAVVPHVMLKHWNMVHDPNYIRCWDFICSVYCPLETR